MKSALEFEMFCNRVSMCGVAFSRLQPPRQLFRIPLPLPLHRHHQQQARATLLHPQHAKSDRMNISTQIRNLFISNWVRDRKNRKHRRRARLWLKLHAKVWIRIMKTIQPQQQQSQHKQSLSLPQFKVQLHHLLNRLFRLLRLLFWSMRRRQRPQMRRKKVRLVMFRHLKQQQWQQQQQQRRQTNQLQHWQLQPQPLRQPTQRARQTRPRKQPLLPHPHPQPQQPQQQCPRLRLCWRLILQWRHPHLRQQQPPLPPLLQQIPHAHRSLILRKHKSIIRASMPHQM